MPAPEFGDNVVIADTPLTREAGFAGEHGVVFGFTTPSVTGISFVGNSAEDRALNVHFERRNAAFWFAPEVVEFLDLNPGLTVSVAGNEVARRSDGVWAKRPAAARPWWRSWR